MPTSSPSTGDHPAAGTRQRRASAHVLAALAGFVLTPTALWALSSGGGREFARMAEDSGRGDGVALVLIVSGAVLLLAVAALGAVSAAAPVTGGLVWGVAPGLVALVVPEALYEALRALPSWLGLGLGTLTWIWLGAVLTVGTLLTGAGLACTLLRRRFSPKNREA